MVVKLRNAIRLVVIKIRYIIFKYLYGMNISESARVSFGAKLDKTHPQGINIADGAYVASGSIIFSHDFSRGIKTDTFIGQNTFIGANVIVMPGVVIGNEVIIGSGSVVTKNVPSNSIVVGNPAKIIKTNIKTTLYGKMIND